VAITYSATSTTRTIRTITAMDISVSFGRGHQER
jgi:hypothetical protein